MQLAKLSILFLFLSLVSCKVLKIAKAVRHQSTNLQGTTTLPFYLSNSIQVPVSVNGIKDTFMFDTGAAFSLLHSGIDRYGISDEDMVTKKGLGLVGGDKLDVEVFKADLKVGKEFLVKNAVMTSYDHSSTSPVVDCKKQTRGSVKNVLGLTNLTNFGNIPFMQIKFSEKTIILQEDTALFDNEINNGYIEVKSDINSNRLKIALDVCGEEQWFIFDTGNLLSGFLLDAEEVNEVENCFNNSKVYEGFLFKNLGGAVADKIQEVPAVNIGMVDKTYQYPVLLFDKSMEENVLGLDFIRHFDWGFDFNEKKVYVKEYDAVNHVDNDIIKQEVLFSISSTNSIEVLYRLKKEPQHFSYGDIIKAVNGVEINESNLCEYLDFLNENANNLDGIQIEVKRNKKN